MAAGVLRSVYFFDRCLCDGQAYNKKSKLVS